MGQKGQQCHTSTPNCHEYGGIRRETTRKARRRRASPQAHYPVGGARYGNANRREYYVRLTLRVMQNVVKTGYRHHQTAMKDTAQARGPLVKTPMLQFNAQW
eukprot:14700044-Alexandrium_andersonii.AAC.1